MKIKQNQDLLKGIFLSMVSVMILTSVYYLNIPDETIEDNEYLKSEICYYTLQGIKSDYHYHFQLNITINGERIEIPTNVGFEKDENGETLFLHPIHTYDNSGRVHVETTKNTTAKLGFFFDIWGEEFNNGKILDYSVDDSHILEMTVNGQNVDTFEETVLEPLIYVGIEYQKVD
jgi:hypothetical protein|tara:strand:+ start:452 stop:976 length:525 start_codon:yes stop_codon:yes gene_type:complete